jgi:Predicted transcriptional regulator
MPDSNFRYYRKAELVKLFGLSRSTIEREVAAGRFPKPYKFGERIVAWRSDEIEEYVNSLPRGENAYSCHRRKKAK